MSIAPSLLSRDCLKPWQSLFVALLAGASLPLAFSPVDIFLLAVVSPAVLFWLCLDSSPRRAFILSYVFGVGFFGVGISWVSVSFYQFGNMSAVLSVAATLLFVLFLALFPAVMAWLSRRYFSRLTITSYFLLLMPALWLLFEWIRSWILTGFPWLNLGNSQTDSFLAGLAPVLGVYGMSWAVVLSSGLLVWFFCVSSTRRLVAIAAIVVIWGTSGLLLLVEWSEPHGEVLSASLLQGNVPQNLKWRPDQRAPTIDLYTRLSRENWHKDIIIWPETAFPAYYHQAKDFLQNLAREARDNGGAELLIGLPVMTGGDNRQIYNSVVRVGVDADDSQGENVSQIYYKSHLVPFGEYIPFKDLLGSLLDILQVPMANFSRGKIDQPLLELAGHKVGVSICYEDVFGEEVIRALPEARFLINVSNDAWFGDSLAPHQHLQMARMRTMETSRPMLRATNNGISAFIDHRGKVITRSLQFEVAVLNGEIQPRTGVTPYVVVGNKLVITVMFLSLLICIFLVRIKS